VSLPDEENQETLLPTSDLNPREKPMGFFDHLEDLRWTVIKCLVTFVIFAGLIGFFLREFNDVVLWPLRHVQSTMPNLVLELGTTTIMEGFSVVIQLCAVGGFALAAPFCLYFVGQFVAPALTEKELKLVLPGVLTGFILFLVGASFSFFLLIPSTISFSVQLNEFFGFVTRWTPASYYGLFVWMLLGVGAAFEFPLLIVLLVYLGMLSVTTLRKYRRHAIVVILIIAAIGTPTPDPFTQLMFAAPLYVLYEISILVSARVEKRRRA
jgi:sec-independent protein translocase protein TatC